MKLTKEMITEVLEAIDVTIGPEGYQIGIWGDYERDIHIVVIANKNWHSQSATAIGAAILASAVANNYIDATSQIQDEPKKVM